MKIYLFLFFTFCIKIGHAESYKIEYKDTDKTYLQVLILDSTANEYLDMSVNFVDANQDSKAIPIVVYSLKTDHQNLSKIYEIGGGVYNIRLGSEVPVENNLMLKNIEIKANKLNTISINIVEGILQFRYKDFPAIPVEYEATIFTQNPFAKILSYKADKIQHVKPIDIYIELNTIPKYSSNLNIDYEQIYEIQIHLEGRLLIKQTPKVSDIEIHVYRLRNRWEAIDYINWNDYSIYPITMEPFHYRISWKKKGKSKVGYFSIESNELIEFICD